MSPKQSLGSMLAGSIPQAAKAPTAEGAGRPAEEATQPTAPPKAPARAARNTEPPAAPPEPPRIPTVTAAARWIEFERKETRQRLDQLQWLESKRKELNAARAGRGERLTDNTLIRVAIDLLMKHGDELDGTTEDELRSSLGL